SLPYEIKITYFFIFIVMMILTGFVIFVILMYNKRQQFYIKEKQLKDAEFKNQILEKELEKQKSLENERARISRDMHDEIGAGISAIKLQSEILKMQSQNISHQEIDELIKISENMNHSMREMLWSLNVANDNIENFTDYCIHYLENYFSKTNINFNFQKNIQNQKSIIKSEIRRNILMVIKESAHNIVKHSQASQATFQITDENQNLKIKISDNGKGFSSESSSVGYGLSSMRSRTESLDGEFSLISDDSGTTVFLSIDLEK
ncbi:MAG: two-component sensor histidine kinase, partial [Chryseobacterium sp.]|nr:two-component sensor histidine kinase [Chryseobacterium sp.]MBP7499936.1 two-component sensor histidine kinase [Chryseobacterium sp.]